MISSGSFPVRYPFHRKGTKDVRYGMGMHHQWETQRGDGRFMNRSKELGLLVVRTSRKLNGDANVTMRESFRVYADH